MALGVSHTHNFDTLPQDLLDVYLRYKRNTRAILQWLLQHGPEPEKPVKSVTLRELETMARTVRERISSIPDILHFYFRETISDRSKLGKYFLKQSSAATKDQAIINHEHFTATQVSLPVAHIQTTDFCDSLTKVYNDLCLAFPLPELPNQRLSELQLSKCRPTLSRNRYEGLAVEEAGTQDEEDANHLTILAQPVSAPIPPTAPDTELPVRLTDDDLGLVFEIAATVQRIQEISSSVEHYWRLAARRTISFPVAAFTTNVAFASLRQLVDEFLQRESNLGLAALYDTPFSFNDSKQYADTTKVCSASSTLLDRLRHIVETLSEYQDGDMDTCDPFCLNCGHGLAKEVQTKVIIGTAGSKSLSEALIGNMMQLVVFEMLPPGMINRSTPLYQDLDDLIKNVQINGHPWSVISGLNILTQSYRVFLRTLKRPNLVSQCRINALKLAQQVSSEISVTLANSVTFPCRCAGTIGQYLHRMQAELQWYVGHNCWDLVSQAPWVAGNHVLEILDLCNYYGSHLLKYRHFVGAILHSYNCLTKLGGLEKIPILEQLCAKFCGVLFPGGILPEANFYACWARCVGARLKFDQRHNGKHTHDNWCFTIPAPAAKAAAGIDIPEHRHHGSSECLLFQIKRQGYHITKDQWKDLARASKHSDKTQNAGAETGGIQKTARASASVTHSDMLLHLTATIQETFTHTADTPLPSARLNVFAVFRKCAHVMSQVSDNVRCKEVEKNGGICICFCHAILDAADRIVKSRRFGELEIWQKDERVWVEEMKKAIRMSFGNVNEEDLLWDI
ncbi:hypothetical protein LTS15_009449 [Exophiala xenobiotica]|nr:hypothetical protein LTS15_009449 [Exophiala xenobiotica]